MTYLGVDFGFKKIGLALSDGLLASPLGVLTVKSLTDSVNQLKEIAGQKNIDLLVIGLPEGKTGQAAKRLAATLEKEGLKVETVEETLSTKRAKENMINMGIAKKKRRLDDAQAAAVILQDYLDEKK